MMLTEEQQQKVHQVVDLLILVGFNGWEGSVLDPQWVPMIKAYQDKEINSAGVMFWVGIGQKPTPEQCDVGEKIAGLLISLNCSKSLAGVGGCRTLEEAQALVPPQWKDICDAYIADDLDSTSAMIEAMKRTV